MTIEIVVGLSHPSNGPLLEPAKLMRRPMLVSANAFSRWRTRDGWRDWTGWMRPINDVISAQVEADRQARNFAFTKAQAAAGKIGKRELAILRGRDDHGYD